MPKETERKFLVRDLAVIAGMTGSCIDQKYLQDEPVSVHVFHVEESAWLTVTTDSDQGTVTHWIGIPTHEADELLAAYAPRGLLDNSKVVIRCRVEDGKGMFAIKGPTRGLSRDEFEYPVPLSLANHWMTIAAPATHKTRYRVPVGSFVFEVDVFRKALSGLVMAEVEFDESDAEVPLPAWLGAEVSHDARYFNSNLAKCAAPPEFAITP